MFVVESRKVDILLMDRCDDGSVTIGCHSGNWDWGDWSSQGV